MTNTPDKLTPSVAIQAQRRYRIVVRSFVSLLRGMNMEPSSNTRVWCVRCEKARRLKDSTVLRLAGWLVVHTPGVELCDSARRERDRLVQNCIAWDQQQRREQQEQPDSQHATPSDVDTQVPFCSGNEDGTDGDKGGKGGTDTDGDGGKGGTDTDGELDGQGFGHSGVCADAAVEEFIEGFRPSVKKYPRGQSSGKGSSDGGKGESSGTGDGGKGEKRKGMFKPGSLNLKRSRTVNLE